MNKNHESFFCEPTSKKIKTSAPVFFDSSEIIQLKQFLDKQFNEALLEQFFFRKNISREFHKFFSRLEPVPPATLMTAQEMIYPPYEFKDHPIIDEKCIGMIDALFQDEKNSLSVSEFLKLIFTKKMRKKNVSIIVNYGTLLSLILIYATQKSSYERIRCLISKTIPYIDFFNYSYFYKEIDFPDSPWTPCSILFFLRYKPLGLALLFDAMAENNFQMAIHLLLEIRFVSVHSFLHLTQYNHEFATKYIKNPLCLGILDALQDYQSSCELIIFFAEKNLSTFHLPLKKILIQYLPEVLSDIVIFYSTDYLEYQRTISIAKTEMEADKGNIPLVTPNYFFSNRFSSRGPVAKAPLLNKASLN